jgi:Polyketide cyclase / dehydrase and lipid transport
MASVHKAIDIEARPQDAWDALRDFGAVHDRLVPGFVVDLKLEGQDRIVTFFNGAVVRERLVAADEVNRRLAYTVVDGPLGSTHHNASAQVLASDDGRTRFVWITDVLPDELAPTISELMDRGLAVIRQTLESVAPRRR